MKETTQEPTKAPTPLHPFQDIRRAAVPLVLYETSDPAQTIRNVIGACNGKLDGAAVMQHDVIRGLTGLNGPGSQLAAKIGPNGPIDTGNSTQCLDLFYKELLQNENDFKRGVCFMHNAHKSLTDPSFIQAVWNLRDPLAAVGCQLVLMTCGADVPPELRQDVITLADPLPTPLEISGIITKIATAAKREGAEIDPEAVKLDTRTHDTLTGLSGFGVRQVFSMSLRKEGINDRVLWERKRRLVEQTKGLAIWQGNETLDDLAGLANLKAFLKGLLGSGNTPVRAIGYLDEIEKMIGGASGDTSGTSQDQLGVILREMQDNNTPGIILLGPPGTGKSAIAKASGKVADAPVISFDLGAAKGSLVGQSEQQVRAMMAVFQAVSQGKGLFIATCNGIQNLPPELRRRFKLGTFFVDLPNSEERAAIWVIWIKRFGLAEQELPQCEGWTGAEVAACCEIAFRTGTSLIEAARYVVPVCKSAADQIASLRRLASGRFISASVPGLYNYDETSKAQPVDTGRALKFD